MSRDQANTTMSGENLSALLDGELDAAQAAPLCAAWHREAGVREIWHTYHLIGDVLRSDDLAAPAARDAAMLRAVRERLAREPVVLAPGATLRPSGMRRQVRRWRGPVAVAAGFMAVAGVLVAMRVAEPPAPELVAATPAPASAPVTVSRAMPAAATPAEVPTRVSNGRLIRDARLDRYLEAHQQFAGSSALGVPSAFLRSATTDAANR